MRKATTIVYAALLCTLLLQGVGLAQSAQTANTLKLDQPTARPKATLQDIKMLVGHWKGEFLGATAEELWLPAIPVFWQWCEGTAKGWCCSSTHRDSDGGRLSNAFGSCANHLRSSVLGAISRHHSLSCNEALDIPRGQSRSTRTRYPFA